MSSDGHLPSRLVLQRPDGEALVYALEQGRSITLGRDASSDILLASHFVSKRHALVSWTPRGVRIEDQDSANGLTVNGLTVHAAQLSPGDVIQIGDQRLVFEVEGEAPPARPNPAPAPQGSTRSSRLALAVLITLLVLAGGGLAGAYLMFLRPARVVGTGTPPLIDPSLPRDTPITPFDSPQAQAIETRARAAGHRPADQLFDEGALAYRDGRLLDAYRLLHGALLRDGQHEEARRMLLRVMGERDLRLRSLQSAASRADEELEFEQAAQQWDAVQALTLEAEPLHARARAEAARLRQRASQ